MVDFKEPRELIPLLPAARDMLASEAHRLHHAAWHDVRGQWQDLSDGKRNAIRHLGWQPGHGIERPALSRGSPIVDNGSGEDFLFMHRQMIGAVRALYDQAGETPIASWRAIPAPGGPQDDGFEIPPNWSQPDEPTRRRLEALKSDTFFWTAMRGWDRQFKNAAYLSGLSLGALGSILEFTVHNDMHMRWSSAPRDPASGDVVPDGRSATDFDPRWSHPGYDFLGEFYSSHVNPVFWRLHGWVDDRIDDWFAAHEAAHPVDVERTTIDGIDWFKPGRWVSSQEPWASPKAPADSTHHGHHGHSPSGPHAHLDPEEMKKVISILYADEGPKLLALNRSLRAPPRATWFLEG
ncbi:MAG TPA: hypothetical protein VF662_01935 [Allosphingosinicella sp.]|jgi:hypothetical protein